MSDKTRWWDYYYVRYFVGAIFGVALLLWLQKHAIVCASERCTIGIASPGLEATALGTLGLSFCYLASAPVLVLHSLRFRFFQCSTFFNGMGIAVAVLVVLSGVCLWRWYGSADGPLAPDIWWILPFAGVLLPQVILLFACPANIVRERYRRLATSRGYDETTLYGKQKGEYIESYRHLREHGNAYAILVAELALALAIASAPNWLFVGGLIAVWSLPAAFVWFIGTWLEFGIDNL